MIRTEAGDDERQGTPEGPFAYVATAEMYWEHQPSFGPYLRQLREAAGLSLRDAAAALGLSFTRLQKLETGGRARAPEVTILKQVAALYGRPVDEVYEQAGIKARMPEGFHARVDYELDFKTLALDPALRPQQLDELWCETFLALNKQQWVEFAHKLEALVLERGACIGLLLAEGANDDSQGEENESSGRGGERQAVTGGAYFIGGQTGYWRHRAGFGRWLRGLREEANLNLRDAAARLGMSFSMLQRLETGARIQPSLPLLWRLVQLYGVQIEQLCEQAGVELRQVEGLAGLDDEERSFATLMFHPRLKPVAMTRHWLQTWPRLQQRQLVEFAWRLERHILGGGARVRELLTAAYRQTEGAP